MKLSSLNNSNKKKKKVIKIKKQISHKKKLRCRKVYLRKYYKNYRKNELCRNKHNFINRNKMKIIRQKKEYSLVENEKNILRNKILLKNKNYNFQQNLKKNIRISFKRADVNHKINESANNKTRNNILRSNVNYIETENFKNTERNKRLRENDDYNLNEKCKNIKRIKIYRQSKEFTCRENQIRTLKYKKCKTQKLKIEKIRYENKLSKQVERLNEIIRYRITYSIKLINDVKNGSEQSKLILNFIKSRTQGPDLICICCDNLFFRKSVEIVNLEKIKLKLSLFKNINVDQFLNQILNVSSEFICKTCLLSISRGKIPEAAAIGSIKFPNVPLVVKNLSPLEERMVSPYIPFMQILALQPYALNPQLSLKGSVVNISVDINEMITTLPRNFNSLSTLQIKLKRHMEHKSDYMHETVRPHLICEAIDYLKNTPLYKKNKITINKDFFQRYDKNILNKTKNSIHCESSK